MKPPYNYEQLVQYLEDIGYSAMPVKERSLTKDQLNHIRQKFVIEEVHYGRWHPLRGDQPSKPRIYLGETLENSMLFWMG
jgi:hypothetical protein